MKYHVIIIIFISLSLVIALSLSGLMGMWWEYSLKGTLVHLTFTHLFNLGAI